MLQSSNTKILSQIHESEWGHHENVLNLILQTKFMVETKELLLCLFQSHYFSGNGNGSEQARHIYLQSFPFTAEESLQY